MSLEACRVGSSKDRVAPGVRRAFLGAGVLCVGLGTVGAIVPLMPSTVFFIVALWCFKRSSQRLELWLLNHPLLGPTLRDWEQTGSMRARTKAIAIGMLWVALAVSGYVAGSIPVWAVLAACGLGVSVYIASRPTKR